MNEADFRNGLLSGNYHRGGIRCLRFFHVLESSFALLISDIEKFRNKNQPSAVAAADHITHWVGYQGEVLQFSLLNGSGRTNDFSTDHNFSCKDKWFFDDLAYPTLSKFIADLPHLINFRIIVLTPGSALPPHEEHIPFRTQQGTIGARLRFHLPINTNPSAEINLDGQVYHTEAGVIHLINHGCVHTAYNHGEQARVHLVWDSLLTKELYLFLFDGYGVPSYLRAIKERFVTPVRHETIGAHRRLAPPLSDALVENLELCEPQ